MVEEVEPLEEVLDKEDILTDIPKALSSSF